VLVFKYLYLSLTNKLKNMKRWQPREALSEIAAFDHVPFFAAAEYDFVEIFTPV
jgi:hypothetical protein